MNKICILQSDLIPMLGIFAGFCTVFGIIIGIGLSWLWDKMLDWACDIDEEI